VTKVNVSVPTGAEATSVHTGVAPKEGVEQFPPAGVRFCATGVPPLMLMVIDCVAGERYAGRRFTPEELAALGASMRIVTDVIAGRRDASTWGTEPLDAPPPQAASSIVPTPNAHGNTRRRRSIRK
jgi:hypothetical protein